MQLQSLLLTLASLLALASATANVAAPAPQQTDHVAITAPAARLFETISILDDTNSRAALDPPDLSFAPINSCLICHAAINTCVGKCGGSRSCQKDCRCDLKVDNAMCTICESITCRPAPGGANIQDRSEDIEATKAAQDTGTSSGSVDKRVPPSINQCAMCIYSINTCKKKCATPDNCDDACRCWNAMHNRMCSACKIPCSCGHSCPRLARRQRHIFSTADALNTRAIPIELLDDPNAKIKDSKDVPREGGV
ncbi:hypothetical protein CC86DRAFT_367002 [Ophiobolus disseminans]|uniref:Membrane anchor Opy2 N-terminal domain-containing protein n=1 Tax=Ophiobolus disseminans TaxID=1469910 RepID=A0A6A7AEE9_9PLEO|nr:hypothetical protein CC86DRAFT_367002 [Ophiobolus disseminans]